MRFILLILMMGFLSACATSYQPNSFSGGYTDMKLGKDMYQVSFKGNGYTGTNYSGTANSNYAGGYNYNGTMNTTTITRHGRTGVIKLFKEGTQPPVAYEAKEILNGFQGE